MVGSRKHFWLLLSLCNLAIVALFGLVLRSKILFPIYFLDYRQFLSAHSHFAFAGWVGLSLITLLIFNLLPEAVASKKIYTWILIGTEVSSLGMALFFPIFGYNAISIFFSSLYIVVNYIFGWVYIKDLLKIKMDKTVRLLSVAAIGSLLVSAIGPLGLVYILLSKSGDSILYRDSIYTFLHFQYNGFFTLSVFALYFSQALQKGMTIPPAVKGFSLLMVISIVPSLFLSLLWHGAFLDYVFAVSGAFLILLALSQFLIYLESKTPKPVPALPFARVLLALSIFSFVLKMLLNVGTLWLQHAIYGDRPVIIGFLHLVFLGFVSFYLLSHMMDLGYFNRRGKLQRGPFFIFTAGVIANEFILGLQGFSILFKTNSGIYNWLLWGAAILLFTGAVSILVAALRTKKATPLPE